MFRVGFRIRHQLRPDHAELLVDYQIRCPANLILENTTVANRPKLNVTYCTAAPPLHPDGEPRRQWLSHDRPRAATYTFGTVVTLTPVPNSGYEFATWTGTNAENPATTATAPGRSR